MLSALDRHALKLFIRGYGKRFLENEQRSKHPEMNTDKESFSFIINMILAEIVSEVRTTHYKVSEEQVQANMQHMRRMKRTDAILKMYIAVFDIMKQINNKITTFNI